MKKNIILISSIIILIALSQWLAVKMIYAHKIQGPTAATIASWYNLKAGILETDDNILYVYLEDYLANQNFVEKFVSKKYEDASTEISDEVYREELSPEQIDEVVWQKLIKDAWLNDVADKNDLQVSQAELDEYIELVGGVDYIKSITEDEYGLSFNDYISLIAKPRVLEEKVYSFLINNYQDVKAVERIQEAYALLEVEDGTNWQEVASTYSDDMTYVDNSLWLQEEDLVDYYEVIKYLDVGDFSKIVKVSNGYIIWKLESLSNDGDKRGYEVQGIFVAANTISDFLNDYLNKTNIKKIY